MKLGSTEERTTKTIFKGEIVTVEPDFQAGSVAMVVRAYDKSHRMMRSRKQRAFLNKTVSDIAKQIAGEYGLSASVGPERRAARLRAPEQRDRLGLPLAAGEARRLRGHARRDHAELRQARRAAPPRSSSPTPTTCTPSGPGSPPSSRSSKVNVRGFDFKRKQAVVSTKNAARAAHRGRHHAAARSRRRSARARWRSRASRSAPAARPTRSPRRRSTSSRTPTSPPRARRSATPRSRRASSSRSPASARTSPAPTASPRPCTSCRAAATSRSSPTRPASTPSSGSRAPTATCRAASTRSWSAS